MRFLFLALLFPIIQHVSSVHFTRLRDTVMASDDPLEPAKAVLSGTINAIKNATANAEEGIQKSVKESEKTPICSFPIRHHAC